MRDQRVYLKTLHGLEPIDVLIKRLGDEWLDPLELRPDSALGVPGLMQAVRAGHLLLANAPGSALLESNAMLLGFPARDQPASLLASHWGCPRCRPGGAASRQSGGRPGTLACAAWSSRPIPGPATRPRSAPCSTRPPSSGWAERIRLQPTSTSLAVLPAAVAAADLARRRHRAARHPAPFAVCDGPPWRVLPGGLTRWHPPVQATSPSMQSGGGGADCWVQTEGGSRQHQPARRSRTTRARTPSKAHRLQPLSREPVLARAATERADNSLRLARLTLRLLQGEDSSTARPAELAGTGWRQHGRPMDQAQQPFAAQFERR